MSNIKKSAIKKIKKIVEKEVKKQENSACFLLGYQPQFPEKLRRKDIK